MADSKRSQMPTSRTTNTLQTTRTAVVSPLNNKNNYNEQIQELWSLLQQQQMRSKSLDTINKSLNDVIDKNRQQCEQEVKQIKRLWKREITGLKKNYQDEICILKERVRNAEEQEGVLREKVRILMKQLEIKDDKIQIIQGINDRQENSEEKAKNQEKNNEAKTSITYEQYRDILFQLTEEQQHTKTLQQQKTSLQQTLQQYQKQIKTILTEHSILKKQKDSIQTQMNYYKIQNEDYQQEIKELKYKISENDDRVKMTIEEQNGKWWKINENLLARVNGMQKNVKQTQERENKLYKEIEKLKEINERERSKNKEISMQLNWYKQLLEEAKGQFVSSQLQKENLNNKLMNEKNQLLKETRRLKQEMGVLKEEKKSSASTSNHKTNTSGIAGTTGTKGSSSLSHKNSSYHRNNNRSVICLVDYEGGLSKTPEKSGQIFSKGRKTPKI